ncbi:MAG TPA: nucleoside hydrolase [Candidatus Melainabacteria bacterium]|nr:nucleoside hydrolase [Candidatus Melainabacteria bacterium]
MPKPVLHDHDGHVDDILSAVLLWMAPEIDLQAIGITNGDCFADQAYSAMVKIATYLQLEGAEIAVTEDAVPNPFPDNWRKESFIINELPLFSEIEMRRSYQAKQGRKIESVFYDCLNNSKIPMTLVTTGPLTNVAPLLRDNPELKSKVEEIVIMGGAFNVPGNVQEDGHDGSAEWNIYADPEAFKATLDTKIPIKLIPLDVTNQLPVTKEFLGLLDESSDRSRGCKLALRLWSLVKGFEYYFWDTLTAAATIKPDLYTFKEMRVDVATSGKSMGKTSTSLFGGRKVQVATAVDKEGFESLLLNIFKSR